MAVAIFSVQAILKLDQYNLNDSVRISNDFGQNGSHLSQFQVVTFPNFRSNSKSGPFANPTSFNHLKYRSARIFDQNCIENLNVLKIVETKNYVGAVWQCHDVSFELR